MTRGANQRMLRTEHPALALPAPHPLRALQSLRRCWSPAVQQLSKRGSEEGVRIGAIGCETELESGS
eukprot:212358-Rhodomonas_salina.1